MVTVPVKDFTLYSTFYVFYMYNFIKLKIDFGLVSQIESFLRSVTEAPYFHICTKKQLLVFLKLWKYDNPGNLLGDINLLFLLSKHLRRLDFVPDPFS